MNTQPHPEATKILQQHMGAVLARLPAVDRMYIRTLGIHTSVVNDDEYLALVGNNKHVAQFIRNRNNGECGILLNVGLAYYPEAVTAYILAHELAHAIQGLDEESADERVIVWGFEAEMRTARVWGRLVAQTIPGFESQPTATMEAL